MKGEPKFILNLEDFQYDWLKENQRKMIDEENQYKKQLIIGLNMKRITVKGSRRKRVIIYQ
jgi:hypothetical protein